MTRLSSLSFAGLQKVLNAAHRHTLCDARRNRKSLITKVHSAVHGRKTDAFLPQRTLRGGGRARKLLILKVHSAVHLQPRQKRRQRPRPNQRILPTLRPGTNRALVFLEIEMT